MSERSLQTLLEGGSFFESPRWHEGRWWVSDFYRHLVLTVDADGNTEEVMTVEGQPSGLGWLPDGDLLVVSMASARQTPMYDPVSHIVYVTRGDDVRTTIVNGKVLMRDRKVLTLDRRQVLADAGLFAEKVRAAVK